MIIPTGYGQVNFMFTGLGVPLGAECTLGFDNDLTQTAQACADGFATIWVSNIMSHLSSNITFAGTLVKLGPNATGPSAVSPASQPGSDGSAMTPPANAFLGRKVTQLGGRKGRGRMFVPGLEDSDVDTGGFVGSGKLSALTTAFNDFLSDATSLDLFPVLLHGDSTTPTLIDELTVDSRCGTQRRRQRR